MVQLDTAKTGGTEKIIRWLLFAALAYGVIKGVNAVAPTLIAFCTNIYRILLLGVPLAFTALYIISNPALMWIQYKRLCRWITSGIIKMDPLSNMEGAWEILTKKKNNLDKVKVNLEGREVKLQRKLNDLTTSMNTNKKMGQTALERFKKSNDPADKRQAEQYGLYLQNDRDSFNIFNNLHDVVKSKTVFLGEVSEDWGYKLDGVRREIDRKREEYQTLKETVSALREAKEFTQASEITRVYDESVKALETNTTNMIAFASDFENKAKGIMKNIDLEKDVRAQEGMQALQGLDTDNYKLPADFLSRMPAETIPYENIPSKGKFNL